ncbi:MAG: hypothetical protein LBQ88_10065 [Treponema sp.]|nr:hypothetical protein [Treponema sp.]
MAFFLKKAIKTYKCNRLMGNLGGRRRAPSDGPPGVKTVWRGLQKFYTLYGYREMFNFMGQV